MYQLKGLIWKAYKVRLRSPLTTAVEIGGPIAFMCLYLVIKLLLGSLPADIDPETANATNIFTNPSIRPLDPSNDLKKYMCSKILFYSASNSSIENSISTRCGVDLVTVASRDSLMAHLRNSLDGREAYTAPGSNLNKQSKPTSSDGCFTLPGSKEPSYQAGIIHLEQKHFELHTTDTVINPIAFLPYAQSSPYNEFLFPHGDLNSGLHLLAKCLNDINLIQQNKYVTALQANENPSQVSASAIKWRLAPYPVTTSATIMPILFLIFNLMSTFCVTMCVIARIVDDIETGLHHYIRSTGVPVFIYWLSHLIVIFIHIAVESLVLALILSIPIRTTQLLDPFYEASLSMKWLLLFSYTFSIATHAMFCSLLYEKTSHAILVTCFLAISYGMYPMTFQVRYTPYAFGAYSYLNDIMLLNPCSTYEALLLVLFTVRMQTNEPTNWSHFFLRSLDGGVSNFSMYELWLLLMAHAFSWFMLLILLDQYRYGPSIKEPLGCLAASLREFFCCNSYRNNSAQSSSGKSTGGSKSVKSALSTRDPNRICCSLRRVCVTGPEILMAHTTSNPLKIKPNGQAMQLQAATPESSQVSKTHQYLVNRSRRPSSAQYREGNRLEEPIFLDESLQQHIAWHKSNITYNNLNLDFKFNQVSFILGQTDLKELFFSTLLGLRTMQSGYVELDETRYTPSTLHLARTHIGYLGERDIFLNEMTIFENLQFFGSLRDPSYSQFDSESLFVLGLLHLSSRKDCQPQVLTNRSARKLALAVASVGHTKLLLLVEPTLNLRWRPRCHVLNLLKKYKSIRSIVVDTSDIDEATAFGDKIVLLKNGRADLDGTPHHLNKKLACGHWLVFEPTTGDRKTISDESVKALEKLTSEVFKQDKLAHLDVTKRSVYKDAMMSKIGGVNTPGAMTSRKSAEIKEIRGHKSKESLSVISKIDVEKLHKPTVILKVQHSAHSNEGLCSLLKIFAQHNIHGFRLAEISYESLEDIIVLRMSKASYPDLPPDLLLSLQHRTIKRHSSEPQVSVRRFPSETYEPRMDGSMFGADVKAILKDRATARREVMLTLIVSIVAVVFVWIALFALKMSLAPRVGIQDGAKSLAFASNKRGSNHGSAAFEHSFVDLFYRERIGFYVIDRPGSNAASYLSQWPLNKALTGVIPQMRSGSDTDFISNFIDSNKDIPASLIIFNPETKDVVITFDKNLPHAMLAAIRAFSYYISRFKLEGYAGQDYVVDITQYNYEQPWHEMITGRSNRRLFYGLGFSIAEGFALGIGVLAPLRHRSETKEVKLRSMYWFAMFLFDFGIAFIQIVCYLIAMVIMEGTMSTQFVLTSLFILLLYKLSSLPLIYLTSLVAESATNAFLFIWMLSVSIAWVFSIHLRSFVENTLFNEGYPYLIANWIILLTPISSLIDALTEISQANRIDQLCPSVPVYTATRNVFEVNKIPQDQLLETQIRKVAECLANGKSGVDYDIYHRKTFGIMWDIYLMLMFGAICWCFLLFSDRVFGILVKRFSSYKTSQDPLKTIIRSSESSLYKWDKEKDRLVSEYIRCTNEARYVRQMAENCVFLRIWMKPMGDQTSIDRQLPHMLEPLVVMGQPKNEIQVELKTTLQVFVRLGNEKSRCKIDKVQLITAYTEYIKEHSDKIVKFAVIDWTRETLYKILLHGYYNTKSTTVA